MIPPLIVSEALSRGINLIAITDHNSSANIPAVQKAAQGTDVFVLPGMELQTKEEVHVLCLFDTLDQVRTFQSLVDKNLPDMKNNPEFFGEQFIVDETGDLIARDMRLLLTSTELTFDDACQQVAALGGLAIPAHVDRAAFGLFANLGFIPPEIPLPALEISSRMSIEAARKKFPSIQPYPLIQSGDVHYLSDFLGANVLNMEKPTIAEIGLALQQKEGHTHDILSLV